jgi:hypothetical protein
VKEENNISLWNLGCSENHYSALADFMPMT